MNRRATSYPKKVGQWLKVHPFVVMLCIVILLALGSQIERFIHKGTILGYSVRSTRTNNIQSAALSDQQRGNAAKNSKVCQAVSADAVEDILNQPVETLTGFSPPAHSMSNFSSCAYQTITSDQSQRTVILSIRTVDSVALAQQTIDRIKQRGGTVVDGAGDQAVYLEESGQLTARKDKRLVTATVSGQGNQEVSSKTATIKFAKLLLKAA